MYEQETNAARLERAEPDGLRTGTVFRKARGLYDVNVGSEMVRCSISNRLRKRLVYPASDPNSGTLRGVVGTQEIDVIDPIAIGDDVEFSPSDAGRGVIKEVLPRRNELTRRIVRHGRAEQRKSLGQVIAANVDQMVPVMAAANPRPKWNLLDRYLVAAEAAGINSLICVTKLDLADRGRLAGDIGIYEGVGYPIVLTSAKSGEGIDAFRTAVSGKRSVLVGKSGVGKTSLLNAMQPGLGLRVKEVSRATGKGTHATSHLEMFPLDGGGGVVDTPGMRVFALAETGNDLAAHFPEMRPYLGSCKFGADCSHTHEPGCAIKDAVERGAVSERRYVSFLAMR